MVLLPRYDYRCTKDHIVEHEFSIKDKPLVTSCPLCGEPSKSIPVKTNVSGALGVYWPSKGIGQGRWIENLTPKPVFVNSSSEYRKLLKATNSREAG